MKSLAATALIIRLNQSLSVHWRDDVERKKLSLSFTFYSKSFVTKKIRIYFLLGVITQKQVLFFKTKKRERELSLSHPQPLGFQ